MEKVRLCGRGEGPLCNLCSMWPFCFDPDDEEDQEAGEGDGHVSIAVGEQQQSSSGDVRGGVFWSSSAPRQEGWQLNPSVSLSCPEICAGPWVWSPAGESAAAGKAAAGAQSGAQWTQQEGPEPEQRGRRRDPRLWPGERLPLSAAHGLFAGTQRPLCPGHCPPLSVLPQWTAAGQRDATPRGRGAARLHAGMKRSPSSLQRHTTSQPDPFPLLDEACCPHMLCRLSKMMVPHLLVHYMHTIIQLLLTLGKQLFT